VLVSQKAIILSLCFPQTEASGRPSLENFPARLQFSPLFSALEDEGSTTEAPLAVFGVTDASSKMR
jgi:hypothetical protein